MLAATLHSVGQKCNVLAAGSVKPQKPFVDGSPDMPGPTVSFIRGFRCTSLGGCCVSEIHLNTMGTL